MGGALEGEGTTAAPLITGGISVVEVAVAGGLVGVAGPVVAEEEEAHTPPVVSVAHPTHTLPLPVCGL